MTVPRQMLCRGRALHHYAEALWIPRYSVRGWVPFDPSGIPGLDSLRRKAAVAAGRPQLTPELVSTELAYDNAIAIPYQWMSQPPDFDRPLVEQHTAFVLEGCGHPMRTVHNALTSVVSHYAKQPCIPTVSYGPRLYNRDCMLLAHLDAYPEHMFSVTITLSGQPWDLEMRDLSIRGEDAQWEVSTHPGAAVLYEGCRIMHSRMQPLQTDEPYVACFFHYRPEVFASGHGEADTTAGGVQYGA